MRSPVLWNQKGLKSSGLPINLRPQFVFKDAFMLNFLRILLPILFLASVIPLQEAEAGDEENCQTYCKGVSKWPKGLSYQPKGSRCGGKPTIEAKGKYAGIFSIVGRNSTCEDRSNPSVPEPSDYKPSSKGTFSGGKYFCFRGTGEFERTIYFSLKNTSTSKWGSGVECYRVKNINRKMPVPKK